MEDLGPSGMVDLHLEVHALLDALPRAIVVSSPGGEIIAWNCQAEALYGWAAEEVMGRPVVDVLATPLDQGHAEEILDVARAGGAWQGELTTVQRDGELVRVWMSSRPIIDESGALIAIVGASDDAAEQRQLLEERAEGLSEHLRLALQAGGLGTFRWDMATGTTTWDEKLEELFGLEPGGFDGTFDAWVALLHPDDRDHVLAMVSEAVESKGSYEVEHRVVWPDGSVHWVQGSGQVMVDRAGNATGTIGCTRDVTAQVVAELDRGRRTAEALAVAERERVHRERLEFLGGINDAVASAADYREVMRNVAAAAVPRLGDWCAIFVLPQPDATIPEIELAHTDQRVLAEARKLRDQFPYEPDSPFGMPRVIRTGQAEFYPIIDDAIIDGLGSDAERDVVRNLALRSSIAVPLVKRGQVLGGLQLVMSNDSRHYTPDDLALAQAVASRIASSLENLRLSEEQRAIASTLQASLLPETLPDIPGVELAVRYWANGDGVDVGGDFYDVFPLGDRSWAVAIGDVCGTGPAAAAVTGLARHTIASAAWHGDDHATVMTHLNDTMRRRSTASFCTALYGTLDPEGDGVAFTFASGGHPLPIIARADGSACASGAPGTLMGLLDAITTTTSTENLEPGDSVILYTDGVTDVAPPYGLTTEELIALVQRAAVATGSAEELADRLHVELSAILPIASRSDDIALLVIRLAPLAGVPMPAVG